MEIFNMKYSEYLPSEKLKSFVLNYWIFEIPKKVNKKIYFTSIFPRKFDFNCYDRSTLLQRCKIIRSHNVKFEKKYIQVLSISE